MRRLERGASFIPLIIVIVLLVVAVVWAWIKTDEADHLQRAKDKLAAENVILNEAKAAQTTYLLMRLAEVVGFSIDPGSTDPLPEYGSDVGKIRSFIGTKLEEMKSKFLLTFPVGVFTVNEETGGIEYERTEDKVTVRYVTAGELPPNVKLDGLYRFAFHAMERMLNDMNRMVVQIDALNAQLVAEKASYTETIAAKDAEISRKTDEYNTLQTSAASRESELSNENNSLRDRLRQAEDDQETVQKAAREAATAARNEILARKQDIVRLKERKVIKEVPPGPDGEVIGVTDGQDLVIIDKGKNKHMMAGLRFDVYDFGKGAVRRNKGVIEVLEVGDYTSKARVIALFNPMFPMVTGDFIESVVYNPEEEMHFFLLGRFQVFGKSDAARRLVQLGAAVDPKVGIDTDYLVMGAPENEEEDLRDSDDYKRAMELGVRVITEKQLGQFLLYR